MDGRSISNCLRKTCQCNKNLAFGKNLVTGWSQASLAARPCVLVCGNCLRNCFRCNNILVCLGFLLRAGSKAGFRTGIKRRAWIEKKTYCPCNHRCKCHIGCNTAVQCCGYAGGFKPYLCGSPGAGAFHRSVEPSREHSVYSKSL